MTTRHAPDCPGRPGWRGICNCGPLVVGECHVTTYADGPPTWVYVPEDTQVVHVTREALELLLQGAYGRGRDDEANGEPCP